MDIRNSLPLDDHHKKIDLEITANGKVANINLKSFKFGADVNAHNNNLIKEENEKIQGSNIGLTVVGIDKIREAYRMKSAGADTTQEKQKLSLAMNQIIRQIENQIVEKKTISMLAKAQNMTKKNKGTRITRIDIINKHSDRDNLIAWGYLSSDNNSMDDFMKAKNALKEDLKNNKKFQEIKKQIGS